MFDFFELLFIVGILYFVYRFLFNKHSKIVDVKEPTVEQAELHRKEVSLMSGKTLAKHFGA